MYNIGQSNMSENSKGRIVSCLKKMNPNWFWDCHGGWYKICPSNLEEKIYDIDYNSKNDNPLVFDKLNYNLFKKIYKKYHNKLYLDFSKANMEDKDVIILCKGLAYFTYIKGLNISFCPKITNKSYIVLSSNLKNLKNLIKINFSCNNMNDQELTNLVKYIDKNTPICEINFSWNNITSIGFITLCKAITTNNVKIKVFDLSGNKIKDDGFKFFGEEIRKTKFNQLIRLNLSHNILGDGTLFCFFTIFSFLPNLEEIDLSYNNITDSSIIQYSSIINLLLETIQFIDISNNKLSEALKRYFDETNIPFNVKY